MTVTLEDLSLLYVLTLIHPQLPVYIRDIFSQEALQKQNYLPNAYFTYYSLLGVFKVDITS